jgi:hypothetical protein
MSYKVPNVPLIVDPVGIDAEIQAIQLILASGLTWLEHSFGRAYTGAEMRDKRKYYYPEVYQGSKEYLSVLPNDNFRSQSFFIVSDPEEVADYLHYTPNTSFAFKVSIVFWYNLDQIKKYEGYIYQHRFTEELKRDILGVLKGVSSFVPERMFETPEEIYKGYSLDHVKEQTLKHPFGGLRIDGTLNFDQCL